MEQKKAVVLLSGGVDSSTCLALAKAEGFALYAMSFAYHQRHTVELAAAERVATAVGVEDRLVVELPLGKIGGSALTADLEVPKSASVAEIGSGIPITYVPARNTVFLSLALAWAEVVGAGDIFIGVNAVDYSGYPDCRPEYIAAFERMANLATKACVEGHLTIKVRTPLINMTKAEIIRKGLELGLDYGLTHSCYDPLSDGRACGHCDSCLLRKKGFEDAGHVDPVPYAN